MRDTLVKSAAASPPATNASALKEAKEESKGAADDVSDWDEEPADYWDRPSNRTTNSTTSRSTNMRRKRASRRRASRLFKRQVPFKAKGDPVFKLENGSNVHFWIKEGDLQSLLSWKDPASQHEMKLLGKTFANKANGHQWFDELAITEDAQGVFRANVSEDGAMRVQMLGSTLDMDEVSPKLGNLSLHIYVRRAIKERSERSHLNIDFASVLPSDAVGIFAELAGTRNMSCLLYTSPSPRDGLLSRMPSSA